MKLKISNMRRLRYGSTSTAITAVVVAVIVLLNILASVLVDRFPATLDLSSDRVFTMSDESIAVAKKLEDELKIVVFLDETEFSNPTSGNANGIPEFDTVMKEFYHILKQYRTHSNDKVSYTFINPDQEPTKFAAYTAYEVEAGDILFINGDKSRKCTIDEMYSMDSSNYATTGSYTFESNVEKTLASIINTLCGGNEQIVQVLVGHEEDSEVINGLKSLYELNGYVFKENTITASQDFDKDAQVMLIAAPAKDYSNAEIQRVQKWVYNEGNYGRQLMVFTSPTADCPNLYEFLDVEYSIQVTDEILLETDFSRIQNYNQLYPMCDVSETVLTENAVSTAKVLTPQARRITTSLTANESGESLGYFGTTLTSYPESAQLIALSDLTGEAENKGDLVYEPDSSEYPLSSMVACIMNLHNNDTGTDVDGHVVVCGSPYMAYADIITNGNYYNEELLLDTMNSMTGAESTLAITTKKISEDTVVFTGTAQLVLGGIFIVALPVLLLVICLVVFLRRKNL